MCEDKDWRWHPWRQIISVSAGLQLEMERSAKASVTGAGDALVKLLAKSNGLEEPDEMQVSASAFKVACVLFTRMNAFAVVKAAHLLNLRTYANRFLELYTTKPLQLGKRGPSLVEAEAADQAVWTEIFRMLRNGDSLDDALHEVTVVRDSLVSLLTPQTKDSQPGKGSGKGLGKQQPRPGPYARGGSAPAAASNPKDKVCFRFLSGRCNDANCRYAHNDNQRVPPGTRRFHYHQ